MRATSLSAVAAALLAGVAALLLACSDEAPARLPDNVTVGIVYNEQAERWHAGAIVHGDRPESILRVLCLTEEGRPGVDGGHSHTGINIDVQPGEVDGLWGFDWSWRIDGLAWDSGRWSLNTTTQPATLVTKDADQEAALLRVLRNAGTAALIGSKDGEERFRVEYVLAPLFGTPVQFAIDECDGEVIEDRAGAYHSAYAYWLPDLERHHISLSERDANGAGRLALSCGPTAFTDDDAPDWIRNADGDIYAAAILLTRSDDQDSRTDSTSAEVATVSWANDDGDEGTSTWDQNHGWLRPLSASDNLRFIDALRNSRQLTVTVEAPDSEPASFILHGAAMFTKPMGAELDACIREYADLNG